MGKFFIARPIFAIALAAAIVLLGIISIFDLPIEQYPDIAPPKFRRPIPVPMPKP
jgi:HAE1 family hydrophobic/amphiphilic exporter-1